MKQPHKKLEYHGATVNGVQPPEYQIWSQIKQRCLNKKHPKYMKYGGRGISMDPRWEKSFKAFLEDVGERPSRDYSIERVDNNKGYYPWNVKWATRKEQARNTSTNRYVTFRGKRMPLAQAAELAGIDRKRAQDRLESGYSQKEAFERPVERGFLYYKIGKETHSLATWVERKGVVSYHCAYDRITKMKWDVERAISTPSNRRKHLGERRSENRSE